MSSTPLRRGPAERLAAWIYTGPLGHLYGASADIASLWVRWVYASAVRRLGRRHQ
jgi:hypothetical protein